MIKRFSFPLFAAFLLAALLGVASNPGAALAQNATVTDPNQQFIEQWERFSALVFANLEQAQQAEQAFPTELSAQETLAVFNNVLNGILDSGTPEDYIAFANKVRGHNAAVDMINAYFAQLSAHQEAYEQLYNTLDPLDTIDWGDVEGNFWVVEDVEDKLRTSPSN